MHIKLSFNYFFLKKVSGADEDLIKSVETSQMELKRVTDELKELKNSFNDKNDQVSSFIYTSRL